MDKIYRRKLLKMAIATPLAFSVALVLDIDPGLSFLGPLFVFIAIWLFPEPIGLKKFMSVKLLSICIPMLFVGAFVGGIWGINSVVLFIFILLTGWGIQIWMPLSIKLGFLPMAMYLAATVLNSSAPYTTAVDMVILFVIALGLGYLVERLFWPILEQQSIKRQISETFILFKNLNDLTFQPKDLSSDVDNKSLKALAARANRSIRAANKALKTATITSSLAPSDMDAWAEMIALQRRLFENLLAISRLFQEYRENPLLHEFVPEFSVLGHSLSATFSGLSLAILSQNPLEQLPNPRIDFECWQKRLTSMRIAGATQSYNLANRLAVGLIEHRLDRLLTEISKSLTWLEIRYSNVPVDLSLKLESAR